MSKHTYEITLHYEVVEYESKTWLVNSDKPIDELLKQHGDLQAVCEEESSGIPFDNNSFKRCCEDYRGDEYSEVIEKVEVQIS
jgi:hypothetical protein